MRLFEKIREKRSKKVINTIKSKRTSTPSAPNLGGTHLRNSPKCVHQGEDNEKK